MDKRVLPVDPEPDTRVEALLIAPENSAVVAGGVKRFAINARDFDGNYSAPRLGVTWDASAGRMNGEGDFTAPLTPGPVMIRARYRGVGASTVITVVPDTALVRLAIRPETAEVEVGSALELTLMGVNAAGMEYPVRAEWYAERGAAVVMNPDLSPARAVEPDEQDLRPVLLATPQRVIYYAPRTVGNDTIRAVIPRLGMEARFQAKLIAGPVAAVQIEPRRVTVEPGTVQVFAALPMDRFGNQVSGPVSWFATRGMIDRSGVYTAPAEGGESIVSARYMGITGIASVNNANIGAITRIDIRPANPVLRLGESQQFIATGVDENGNTVSLSNPMWETNNGTVDGYGFYTTLGASVGPARIRVTANGIVGETTATVITWN